MAQESLTYQDKTNPVPVADRATQTTAEDFNEIKATVNANATDAENRLAELEKVKIAWAATVNISGDIASEKGPLAPNVLTTKTATGMYTITHDIGHTNYYVQVGQSADSPYALNVSAINKSNNAVDIQAFDSDTVNRDVEFDIVIFY